MPSKDNSPGAPLQAYTTVHVRGAWYVAVLIEPSEHGFAQVSDEGAEHSDYVDAKREAVDMARAHQCNFRVPHDQGQEI